LKIRDLTISFIQQRVERLKGERGEWNDRASLYERVYLMNLWDDTPEPDERRLVAPTAWTRVESYKALLLARPPVISVPASSVQAVAEDQADQIEKYLWAAWYQADVLGALNHAEWFACAFGEGVLRCLYDDLAADGDFPLLIHGNIDPRNVYALASSRAGLDIELAHSFKRTRAEIEDEWGELPGHPDDSTEAGWLDEEIDFCDYWRVDTVIETRSEPVVESEEESGPVTHLVKTAAEQEEAPEAEEPEVENVPAEIVTKRVRKRVVTNAIVAGDDFIKKPTVMPGYSRIPFVRFAGIETPLKGADGALSILFPITAGSQVGNSDVKGVVAALSELLGHRQRIVEMFANGATVVIGADADVTLDFSPSAQNFLPKDAKVEFLVPPGPHPAVDGQLQILDREIEDATISASMMGRHTGDVSGLALSAMASPVLMRIAHRQQIRERAYQDLNELILALTEFYSGPDGWEVWGTDRIGGMIDMVIRPEDINGYYRNRVKLSASLPKDANGDIMIMANLVTQNLISHETFLDHLQQVKDLVRQSPMDEIKAVLRDKMLFGSEVSEILAKLIVTEYSQELADALGITLEPEQPQQPGMPQMQGPPQMPPGMMPPPGMPGTTPGGPPLGTANVPAPPVGPPPGVSPGGPMQGIGPGVVAPIPEMSGAQGTPEGLAAMLQMTGQPLPPELVELLAQMGQQPPGGQQ